MWWSKTCKIICGIFNIVGIFSNGSYILETVMWMDLLCTDLKNKTNKLLLLPAPPLFFSQHCKKQLLALACLSVCLSVCLPVHPSACTEQLNSHWMGFHDNRYLSVLQKSVEKIQVSLKSDKSNEYLMWRPGYIFYHFSLSCF